MITRKEYMDASSGFELNTLEHAKFSHENHNNYYRQFVKASATGFSLSNLTKIALSYDKISSHLNEIPLKNWDNLQHAAQSIFDSRKLTEYTYPKNKDGKIYYSLSDVVCISKLIVRDYLLANGYIETWERGQWGYECFIVKTENL